MSNEHNNGPSVPQGRPFGHFRAEPFGWTDCAATDDGAIALYEHPMTNPWRDAVIEQLESWHIYVPAIHDNSPRLAIKALVRIETQTALDPAVSSEAAALAAQGVQAHTPAVPQGLPAFDDLDDDVIDAACTAGSLLYRVDLMRAYECIRKALAATPTPAPAVPQGEPVAAWLKAKIEKHALLAADCPGSSSVVLKSALLRFLDRLPPVAATPAPAPAQDAKVMPQLHRAVAKAQQIQPVLVLVVEKEPDYWSGGHFHEGTKSCIDPTKVWALPIGTKLYADSNHTPPVPCSGESYAG